VLSDFVIKLEFSLDTSVDPQMSNFNGSPSSVSRFVPCGQIDVLAYGRTDMAKLIVTLHNSANWSKN